MVYRNEASEWKSKGTNGDSSLWTEESSRKTLKKERASMVQGDLNVTLGSMVRRSLG